MDTPFDNFWVDGAGSWGVRLGKVGWEVYYKGASRWYQIAQIPWEIVAELRRKDDSYLN